MNTLTKKTSTGTVGELLVQIRLLEHGVQAAPPLKDSGNDLIAIYQETFKAISVRATTVDTYTPPNEERLYHLIAVVALKRYEGTYRLDESEVYLVENKIARGLPNRVSALAEFRLNHGLLQRHFPSLPDQGEIVATEEKKDAATAELHCRHLEAKNAS